jgi:capsular polysaccharide transport system permease protein
VSIFAGALLNLRYFRAELRMHRRVIWALLMRELSTRYGRDNLGFFWVICEPLLFAGSVSVLWSVIKPPFEHGIHVVPFVITGYLPIILVRHMLSHGMNFVRVNADLLYHRQITVLHLFIARVGLEFIGVTLAFICIFFVLWAMGLMKPPERLALVYMGWLILAWISCGLALIFGALGELYEFMERFVSVVTYILVPLSGTFYMVAWVPAEFRRWVLVLPFIHPIEMIRGGFFGEFVPTYFNAAYASAWAAGFTLLGLVLTQFVRGRVEVE